MIAALRQRWADGRGDDGMTLVELLITMALLVGLLGLVMVSMSLIESISTSVSSQYQEFNQVVPVLAPIRTLVASEVEPAPQTSAQAGNVPTPGFKAIGNFSAIWYANIGTAHGNVVGASASCSATICTAGPALIAAVEVDAAGNGVTSATNCADSSCKLQVWQYLPLVGVTAPGVSTCPVPVNGTANGTCQYPPMDPDGTPAAAASASQYSGKVSLIANIQDVVNNPSNVDGNGVPLAGEPLFTFAVYDPTVPATYLLTPADLSQSPQVISELPGGSEPLSTCTGPSVAACPMDAIQSVGIHLKVNAPGSGTNGLVENHIIDYRLPLSVQDSVGTCYPFQYSPQSGCNPYQS